MKVFISQPVKGKTDEQIGEERALAVERIKCQFPNEEIEVIDSFFEGAPHDAKPLWFLGESLKLLADADLAYFIRGWDLYSGRRMENKVAKEYGIDVIEEYKMKGIITAKFIKGRVRAIITLDFWIENDDETIRAANKIITNLDQYPEFTSIQAPKMYFKENTGRVVFNGLVDNNQESKDAIIRLTHHAEGLYENTNAEYVHVEVCINGKWYGRD